MSILPPLHRSEAVSLSTKRLLLRELEEADWTVLAAYAADPEVRREMLPGQGTAESCHRLVQDALTHARKQPRSYFPLGIVWQETGELIGTIVLTYDVRNKNADIGWDLNRAYWNRGIMTEAARAMLDFAFDVLQAQTVHATCSLSNRASIRVMEKAGMKRLRLSLKDHLILAKFYKFVRLFARYRAVSADRLKRPFPD